MLTPEETRCNRLAISMSASHKRPISLLPPAGTSTSANFMQLSWVYLGDVATWQNKKNVWESQNINPPSLHIGSKPCIHMTSYTCMYVLPGAKVYNMQLYFPLSGGSLLFFAYRTSNTFQMPAHRWFICYDNKDVWSAEISSSMCVLWSVNALEIPKMCESLYVS